MAQKPLPVQEAISLAISRNLELKQQVLTTQTTAANLQQSKEAFLPSANASIDYRWQFGTVFDPLSFQRVDQATSFSNPQLTANWDVFRGFSRWYTYKQNESLLEANRFGEQRIENQVITQLLQQYLQLALDQQALEVALARQELLEKQLERIQTLFDAGSATEVQVKNLQAQIALEEVNVVNAKNRIARDKLQIYQTLQITDSAQYLIVTPSDVSEEVLEQRVPELQSVLDHALVSMPEVREQRANILAAEQGVQVAKGGYYPRLSLSAAVTSNYTSNGGVPVYDTLEVGGFEVPQVVGRERTEYFPQLNDNFSQFAGVTLAIPIYNNGQVRRSIEVANINVEQAELGLTQVQMGLRQTVETTHLDANAAYQRLQALQIQIDATQLAFDLAQSQYQAGALNFYDYLEALNNRTQAEVQRQQTAYEYFFLRKLLDFYAGKPLDF